MMHKERNLDVLLTLSKSVEFAHERSQDERRFCQIINQMRPHTAKSDQDAGHRQIDLERETHSLEV
jgi:hypothetical protein